MAILGASFQIGRSALAAYQAAIAITGQNIANLGNADYTRQTGRLTSIEGGSIGNQVAPGGVNLSGLKRNVDQAVEARLRMAIGSLSAADSKSQILSQIEGTYNELTDYDLSTQLTQFFNSFGELQHTPDDTTARNLILSNADTIARSLQYQRSTLLQQATDLNKTIGQEVDQANSIAGEIADLNVQIVAQEARGPGYSSALRDRRDSLLRDLSELMDVDAREQSNGSVTVYVGSEPLVEYGRSRGLKVETQVADGLEQADVRFADTDGSVTITDGKLASQLQARSQYLVGQVQQLDQLARGLIYEVNRAHSNGSGLIGYTSLTGTYAVNDPDAALNSTSAGLTYPVKNGTFIVHMRDKSTGETITRQINVDLDGLTDPNNPNDHDTSLSSLAAALGNVPGLTASVTSDNRLKLEAADGSEFWFSDDTSGALAALGVGTFLTGTDAATIAVQSTVRDDPRLIAAGLTGATSDGDNAGKLAALGETDSDMLGGRSIHDFQAALVNQIAVAAKSAQTAYDAADAVHSSLVSQREAVSGVSVDEEAINLTKYEQAFAGSARFLSVVDSLATEILSLIPTA